MSAYTMNVFGDFRDSFDCSLLNLKFPPINHGQNIEDVFILAKEKTGREMAIIVLCDNKVLRKNIQDIGRHINKDRKAWDKVPVVAISSKQRDWQTRVVGFFSDAWVFAEKGISEDKTGWIADLYGTRAKL